MIQSRMAMVLASQTYLFVWHLLNKTKPHVPFGIGIGIGIDTAFGIGARLGRPGTLGRNETPYLHFNMLMFRMQEAQCHALLFVDALRALVIH